MSEREEPQEAALRAAVANGQTEDVRSLLTRGVAPDVRNATPLQQAICRGGPEAVRFLIARGADVNKASMGMSPLAYAEEELPDAVEWLLAAGARK
jgi:ankyrin repeat protein